MIQVGDRIKCVDARSKYQLKCPLIEGRDYIAYAVDVCACGVRSIDVGFTVPPIARVECQCKRIRAESGDAWAFYEHRFRKIEPEYKAVMVDSEISEQAKELIGITETIANQ